MAPCSEKVGSRNPQYIDDLNNHQSWDYVIIVVIIPIIVVIIPIIVVIIPIIVVIIQIYNSCYNTSNIDILYVYIWLVVEPPPWKI